MDDTLRQDLSDLGATTAIQIFFGRRACRKKQ
jgi:hypothetical protein